MIYLDCISKSFEGLQVIKPIKYTFGNGKSYLIQGSSGTGKSTLLNMIAGVITPDEGSIVIDGHNITELSTRQRDRFRLMHIGYVFHDFKLFDEMTVLDNLEVLKIELDELQNINTVLESLGLLGKERRKVKTLSGGEKQRVAIARSLLKKPLAMLADEPTGNLNSRIALEIISLLVNTSKVLNIPLIVVSHDTHISLLFDVIIDIESFENGVCDDA